ALPISLSLSLVQHYNILVARRGWSRLPSCQRPVLLTLRLEEKNGRPGKQGARRMGGSHRVKFKITKDLVRGRLQPRPVAKRDLARGYAAISSSPHRRCDAARF